MPRVASQVPSARWRLAACAPRAHVVVLQALGGGDGGVLLRRSGRSLHQDALEVDQLSSLLVESLLQLPLVPVVGVELVLQHHNLLVPLVQPLRQRDHDVALLEQQLLVPIHLSLLLLDLLALTLQVRELALIDLQVK